MTLKGAAPRCMIVVVALLAMFVPEHRQHIVGGRRFVERGMMDVHGRQDRPDC